MDNEQEFIKQMENLEVPDVDTTQHQQKVKMTIMNADRSAALGVWLVVVPCYFLFCVFMYYFFHIHMSLFQATFDLMAGMDKNPALKYMSPILLVGLPIVSIIINKLAILHVHYQKNGPGIPNELLVTIKLRFWNIVLILISLGIVLIFVAYAITENLTLKR